MEEFSVACQICSLCRFVCTTVSIHLGVPHLVLASNRSRSRWVEDTIDQVDRQVNSLGYDLRIRELPVVPVVLGPGWDVGVAV
jgi:hypothetical protein